MLSELYKSVFLYVLPLVALCILFFYKGYKTWKENKEKRENFHKENRELLETHVKNIKSE